MFVTYYPCGQLGNQMFSYAAALGFAEADGHPFKLPPFTTEIDGALILNHPRCTPQETANAAELHEDEKRFGHCPALWYDKRKPVKLMTNFMSSKYFPRKLSIVFQPQHVEQANRVAKKLDLRRCVGVHVRRGDYLTSPKHVSLGLDYFVDAMSTFKRCTFVVVSDDPDWCRRVFCNAIVVNTGSAPGDMYLLSRCDAGMIMSNSTFSWWGAWLGRKERTVICPSMDKWLCGEMEDAVVDVAEENWTLS